MFTSLNRWISLLFFLFMQTLSISSSLVSQFDHHFSLEFVHASAKIFAFDDSLSSFLSKLTAKKKRLSWIWIQTIFCLRRWRELDNWKNKSMLLIWIMTVIRVCRRFINHFHHYCRLEIIIFQSIFQHHHLQH